MHEPASHRRARGARIGWGAAIAVAAALTGSGCHAGATGDTAGGAARGSAAAQEAGHAPVTQAEIAARVNADGERLMRDGKYAAAAQKFLEAAARWPEVQYLINGCSAQLRAGDFERALRTCQGARNAEPKAAQRTEIEGLIRQILQAAKQHGIELCDGCIYEAPPDPPPH